MHSTERLDSSAKGRFIDPPGRDIYTNGCIVTLSGSADHTTLKGPQDEEGNIWGLYKPLRWKFSVTISALPRLVMHTQTAVLSRPLMSTN